MTSSFVSLRRSVALSVAIALCAVPIASAQSPEAGQPTAAPANTALLSPAAFARLVQQAPAKTGPAPLIAAAPRTDLLRQVTAAMAREARATAAKAPQQGNWAARHKVATFIGLAVLLAYLVGWSVMAGASGD
jgi:hypothetical protein